MRFSFGKNWRSFAARSLDHDSIERARSDFHQLLDGIPLKQKRFLDIGFGQGLGLMFASEAGAEAFGIDLDPICAEALEVTASKFPEVEAPPVKIASILDPSFVQEQLHHGAYDVVHSWGVLHHTGDMHQAFEHADALVKPEGGHLVIAIYNRHWTSPIWKSIKILFNRSPKPVQELMVWGFYPVCIVGGKLLGRKRGMDILHDVRDWLGGYPYEYASVEEIHSYFEQRGYLTLRTAPSSGWTGCNEFIFQKKAE